MNRASYIINLSRKIRFRLFGEAIIIGLAAGLVTSLYRIALTGADKFCRAMYAFAAGGALNTTAVFALLIAAALVCGLIVKSEPMIKGSGIPQVEGKLLGRFEYSWLGVLVKKFVAGTISLGAGLSLGREGPSIQLGACAGEAFSKLFKRTRFEEKYMITCGAAAGLSSAFNAPFSGVMFALEEVHKSFSPNVLLSAIAAAAVGDFVSKTIFGTKTVFDIASTAPVPAKFYGLLIVMGILLGLFGALYNVTLIGTQKLYGKIKIPDVTKQIIPFLIAGVLGLILPEVLGGGHGIIEGIMEVKYTLMFMVLLLTAKFLFSMVSFGSGAAGGIFFPLLVLGALFGAICGTAAVDFCGLPTECVKTFMLLGMVGMFTGIVRAPVTGIALIVEMSGSIVHLLPLTVVAALAYAAADLTGVKPVYELLLERISGGAKPKNRSRIIVEIPATESCKKDGALISTLRLPENGVLLSVRREGEEFMPNEAERVRSGDVFVVMCCADEEDEIRSAYEKLLQRGAV